MFIDITDNEVSLCFHKFGFRLIALQFKKICEFSIKMGLQWPRPIFMILEGGSVYICKCVWRGKGLISITFLLRGSGGSTQWCAGRQPSGSPLLAGGASRPHCLQSADPKCITVHINVTMCKAITLSLNRDLCSKCLFHSKWCTAVTEGEMSCTTATAFPPQCMREYFLSPM